MSIKTALMDMVLGLGQAGKQTMSSYCFIESVLGNNLIMRDGSLETILRFDGSTRMITSSALDEIADQLTMVLSAPMSQSGHAIQVTFSRNPETGHALVERYLRPTRTVTERLKMDMGALLDEQEEVLSNFVVNEAVYFVLWTRMSILSKDEKTRATEEQKSNLAESAVAALWPEATDVQDVFRMSETVASRHNAFVNAFVHGASSSRLKMTVLPGHQALRAIHQTIYPDKLGDNWQPRVPEADDLHMDRGTRKGEVRRSQWHRPDAQDPLSYLLWPRIDGQLFNQSAEMETGDIVRIGNNYFATVDMTAGPQRLHRFPALIRSMRVGNREFPWRMSFTIEGEGLKHFSLKKLLAKITSFSAKANNTALVRELTDLEEMAAHDTSIVRIRVCFATWSPVSAGLRQIEQRSNALQRAVEGWGFCQVSPSPGDPLGGVLGSVPGLDIAPTAPAGAAPLSDVISLMPWQRDASPFNSGVLFRTPDGRPFPYQMGSSLQDGFVDIIYAVPGKGKSVLLNTTNLAFCLSASATQGSGGSQLPLVRILDIGPSSQGLISLLTNSLPAARRHEAVYRELRMHKNDAINPFDTPLGCRKPLEMDRTFLKNFLTVLGTPDGQDKPPEFLSDLLGVMIDEVYKKFSDREKRGSNPRIYTDGDPVIEEAIRKHGLSRPETWWGLVDTFMFEVRDMHLASLAQRHAVPRLEDLMSLDSRAVNDIYGNAGSGRQSLVETFKMMVATAVREYPILAYPTRFDISNARVVSLNIQAVTYSGGGAAGRKRIGLMYMLGRFILTSTFYHNEQIITEFDERYRDYHIERIKRLRETPKRVVFDEFHRTSSAQSVREQIEEDMREGRKWEVQIALASQLLGDFSDNMLSLATGMWLLGVENADDLRDAVRLFALSPAAESALRYEVKGPRKDGSGSPFLCLLSLKSGREEHLLMNTLSPQMAWAFSTTAQDVGLRNRLYARLAADQALKRLAARYPNGSAKSDIENRNNAKAELGETGEDTENGVIDEIAAELLAA